MHSFKITCMILIQIQFCAIPLRRHSPSQGLPYFRTTPNARRLLFRNPLLPFLQTHFKYLHRSPRLVLARRVLNILVATSPTASSPSYWTFLPYSKFSKRQSTTVNRTRGAHQWERRKSINLLMCHLLFYQEQVMTWRDLGCASHTLRIHMDR